MGQPHRLISLAHLSALRCTPPELVTIAADAGFESVGLRLAPAVPGEAPFPMLGDSEMRRETLRRMKDRGVIVHDVEVLILRPDVCAADYAPLFEASAELGARYILVNSEDEDESRMTDRVGSLCDAAAPYGLSLGLEFMRYRQLKSLAQTRRILKAANRTNAVAVIDTLHFFRADTLFSDLEALPPGDIGFIQLADAPEQSPPLEGLSAEARSNRLLPGEGRLPLGALLRRMPADRALSLEVPTSRAIEPTDHARQALAATRRLLSQLD